MYTSCLFCHTDLGAKSTNRTQNLSHGCNADTARVGVHGPALIEGLAEVLSTFGFSFYPTRRSVLEFLAWRK